MSFQAYLDFRTQFAEVLDQRYYPLEWLAQRVLNGTVKVWATDDAALMTEIKDYPTGASDIHVLLAAGNIESIVGELREEAEDWAKAHGCLAALIESREGWAKALKPFGYETHQTTVRKEL